jgi:arylsulfatase A-like enzyme
MSWKVEEHPVVSAAARIPHRIFRVAVSRGGAEQNDARGLIGVWAVLAGSVGLGLAGGFSEVVARLVRGAIHPRLTASETILNWHWPWMTPLAWTPIVLVLGVIALVIRALQPKWAVWICPRAALAIVLWGGLFSAREIHPLASGALAAGVAISALCTYRLRANHVRAMIRVGLPILIAAQVVLITVCGGYLATAEMRAIASLTAARPDAPNVVLIVLDTVRARSLSVYGYERATTPNLSRLASQGALFHQARSPANWTLPSHASMFTGRWPHELSVSIDMPLDNKYPTLAEAFRDRGYLTGAFVGNQGYGNAWFGLGRGFAHYQDHWQNRSIDRIEILRSSLLGDMVANGLAALGVKGLQQPRHRKFAHMVNAQALGWLDSLSEEARSRPFFLFMNYIDAHGPYQLPKGVSGAFGANPQRMSMLYDRIANMANGRPLGGVDVDELAEVAAMSDGNAEITRLRAMLAQDRTNAYDSCIHELDRQVGLLVDEFERRGELESTIFVVTSDHGEHLGEHNLFNHGNSLYQELVHVPLLMFGPGIPGGVEYKRPVSTRSLATTLCDLADITEHAFPTGSLAHSWRGVGNDEPVLSSAEHVTRIGPTPEFLPTLGPMWAIASPTHTYIHHGAGEELYDLEGDPREANNLVDDPRHSSAKEAGRAALQSTQAAGLQPAYRPATAKP